MRASTESTVDCFTFNTKMTKALLFWRESLRHTTHKPLKQNRRHIWLSCSNARKRSFNIDAFSSNVWPHLIRTTQFCAGRYTAQQLSLFVYRRHCEYEENDIIHEHAEYKWHFVSKHRILCLQCNDMWVSTMEKCRYMCLYFKIRGNEWWKQK